MVDFFILSILFILFILSDFVVAVNSKIPELFRKKILNFVV